MQYTYAVVRISGENINQDMPIYYAKKLDMAYLPISLCMRMRKDWHELGTERNMFVTDWQGQFLLNVHPFVIV